MSQDEQLTTTFNNLKIQHDVDLDTTKCIELLQTLKKEEFKEHIQEALFEIKKISKIFPPRKNENKMVYGKLAELAICEMLTKLNINDVKDLDKNHASGSEYQNDIKIDSTDFSIKTKLNKGPITMINCKSKSDHKIDVNTIIMVIKENKMYIIPKSFDAEQFIKRDAGSIYYSGKLLTYIDKNRNDLVYNFPKLTNDQEYLIEKLEHFDYIDDLYRNYIKS